jgi:arginase
MGPDGLRTAGLIECFGELGRAVVDHGDVAVPRVTPAPADPAALRRRNAREVVGVVRELDEVIYSIARRGEVPVVLGGDHSLAMGSATAVARHCREAKRELFVLWLDAHADFNTPATSPTGNIHGMPMAYLCGEPGFESLMGAPAPATIAHRNLTLFGLRSVDREERALLQTRGVQVMDMRVIDEIGVPTLMRKLLAEIADRRGVLHVSLDADFIDPSLAPGVGTPVPGGVTYREAHLVMEMLCDSGLVASLDLVELNPYRDDRGKTARLLVELTASLFGRQIFHHSATR